MDVNFVEFRMWTADLIILILTDFKLVMEASGFSETSHSIY